MASTKIIFATVPKSDQVKTFDINMLPASRKAQILQQMAAATDANLGLQVSNKCREEMPDSNPAPRKRQRLTHLSTEEKMMRRKLKNRVAAQTARDRKKAQFDDLEVTLTVMEARNKQLLLENTLLKKQNETLLEENKELKERLQGNKEETQSLVVLDHGYCMDSTPSPISTQPTMKKEVDVKSPESAALNAPPQQELARHLLTFLSMMLMWSLKTNFWGSSVNSTRQPSTEPFVFSGQKTRTSLKEEEPLCLVTRKTNNQGNRDWWGPQQQSWNPSKN
nr:X-box-binding protein 1-like [Lytechinus pictus]